MWSSEMKYFVDFVLGGAKKVSRTVTFAQTDLFPVYSKRKSLLKFIFGLQIWRQITSLVQWLVLE